MKDNGLLFLSRRISTERIVCVLFFLSFLILGISIIDDYGLSWDESFQRLRNGLVVHNFVFHGMKEQYLDSVEKYHGPAIEWPLYTAERLLRLSDERTVFLFRHLIIFLFFYISCIFFYKLIRELYSSWQLALIGTLIYIASPRIFADAFYNTKDIGGLAVLTICMYTGLHFYRNPDKRNAIFHGLICGYLVAIRVPGIIIPVISVCIIALQQLAGINKLPLKKLALIISILTISTVFSMTLFWPIMWLGPKHLYLALIEMSHYGWAGKNLFMGAFIKSTNLPWFYIPVWVGITTPVITLLLLLFSLIYLVSDTIKLKSINKDLYFNNLAILGYLTAPVIAVIVFKSVLYDGWRHMYFINGAMTALACYPVYRLHSYGYTFLRKIIYPVVFISLLPVIFLMIKMHPYENIYFNRLAFKNAGEARFLYEMDYWGLSYRKGLEYIIQNDKRPHIKVFVDSYPGSLNAKILRKSDSARLEFLTDSSEVNYIIGNYRGRDEEYEYKNEVFSVITDNAKILSCYKLTNP